MRKSWRKKLLTFLQSLRVGETVLRWNTRLGFSSALFFSIPAWRAEKRTSSSALTSFFLCFTLRAGYWKPQSTGANGEASLLLCRTVDHSADAASCTSVPPAVAVAVILRDLTPLRAAWDRLLLLRVATAFFRGLFLGRPVPVFPLPVEFGLGVLFVGFFAGMGVLRRLRHTWAFV